MRVSAVCSICSTFFEGVSLFFAKFWHREGGTASAYSFNQKTQKMEAYPIFS